MGPRRSRRNRDTPTYYEEHWIERRTRRRGNVKKFTRRDSRSFSEEELQLLKETTREDHQRRSHSESAKYDDDQLSTDELCKKVGRKYSKIRKALLTSEKSDSDSDKDTISRLFRRSEKHKKGRSDVTAHKKKTKSDSESVSDDSLEVIIRKKKDKTPKEDKNENSNEPSVRNPRKISFELMDDPIEDTAPSKKPEGPRRRQSLKPESRRNSLIDKDNRPEPDITDSTSRETVEQVTVVAEIHKDQEMETPRIKEKEREDIEELSEKVQCEEEASQKRMDEILEKADELHASLMNKAADLKKDMEEMRQQNWKTDEPKESKTTDKRRSSVVETDLDEIKSSGEPKTTERRASVAISIESQPSSRRVNR